MNYNKILVIQTAFLGDVIMSTPLIRALREVFLSSEIDVLTIPETSIIFKESPLTARRYTLPMRYKPT